MEQQEFRERFLFYVIAACHPKMHHRINSAASEAYAKALQSVDTASVPQSFKAYQEPSRDPIERAETRADINFLIAFHTACTTTIPGSTHRPFMEGEEMPKIRDLARVIATGGHGKVCEFYSERTLKEFHQMLRHILDKLRESLLSMFNAKRKTARKHPHH